MRRELSCLAVADKRHVTVRIQVVLHGEDAVGRLLQEVPCA